jgi:hypothetical protein
LDPGTFQHATSRHNVLAIQAHTEGFLLSIYKAFGILNLWTWLAGWNSTTGLILTPHMIRDILFIEEAHFTRDGVDNKNKSHISFILIEQLQL